MTDNAFQTFLDIQEITQLKSRYCRFVDTKDWARFGGLLVEDYSFEGEGIVTIGRDKVVAFVSKSLQNTVCIHRVCNPEIIIDGDSATGIWSMTDYVVFDEPGMKFSLRGYGWYHENYVRTAEGWRLARCVEKRHRVDLEGDVPRALLERMAGLPGYHIEL